MVWGQWEWNRRMATKLVFEAGGTRVAWKVSFQGTRVCAALRGKGVRFSGAFFKWATHTGKLCTCKYFFFYSNILVLNFPLMIFKGLAIFPCWFIRSIFPFISHFSSCFRYLIESFLLLLVDSIFSRWIFLPYFIVILQFLFLPLPWGHSKSSLLTPSSFSFSSLHPARPCELACKVSFPLQTLTSSLITSGVSHKAPPTPLPHRP